MSADPRPAAKLDSVTRAIGLVMLAVAAVWLAWQLWTVIVIVVVALVLVGTFDPVVSWLERRGLRRRRALVLIFVVMTLLLAVIALLTVPPLLGQVLQIVENAPKERAHLIAWLSQYDWANSLVKTIQAVPVDEVVARAGAQVIGYSSDVLGIVGYGVTTIFLAMYLLAEPKRSNGALYALVPRHHHMKLARILIELESIVGGYMRGQLITSVSIAVFMYVMLTALRVDDALAIAIFAGLTDIIPFVGGILASAPAIVGASAVGTTQMVVVAVLCFAYQEFENRILVPRVYGRQLRLSPAVVLVALLIGGTLLGVLGALLALPIAAGVQMIVQQLRVELPGESDQDETTRAQDAKAERIYATLTHDATAADASVIAGELAQKMKDSEEAGTLLTTADVPVLLIEMTRDPVTGEPSYSVSESPSDDS